MLIWAIDQHGGGGRQYLSGSPYVDAAEWSREEAMPAFARQSATRADGDRCSETMDFLDEGQTAVPTSFMSRREYASGQAAQEALATLPSAHRWSGRAVALLQSDNEHLWHEFTCDDAILQMTQARRVGCMVIINYVFQVGVWSESVNLFDDEA